MKDRARQQAADHRRRFLHGWRYRPAACAVRRGGKIWRHHDGGRCACFRRAGPQRPRHHRPFQRARPRRYSGGHALEGHRRAGRLRLRIKDLIDFLYHRARPFLFSTSHPPSVAATCIAAFDVLEEEPRAHGQALGEHPLLQEGARALGLQHRRPEHSRQRNADHAHHHR